MNKEKSTSWLPKIIGPVLVIVVILFGINYYENIKADNEEFFEKGGAEALSFKKGEYDSLMIAGLKVKYPNDYKIEQNEGNEILGEYVLLKQFPQSQLIIGYEPLKNADGILYNSIDDVLKRNISVYGKFLRTENNVNPKVSDIKSKKIGDFDIKYIETTYDNNTLHLYALQTKTHIFRFTSHKNFFLDNLIRGIEDYEEIANITPTTKDTIQTEYKTVHDLKIPLYDWEIFQDIDIAEIKTHQFVLKRGADLIAIMSITNEYINDLKEYSDYYNEKTVRNMKPSGLILTSKEVKLGKFNGLNSVTEYFSAYHQPTDEKFGMEAITIKIKDFFYNITYNSNTQSEKIINNIEIIK